MAKIITLQHEDITRALISASLETRELGFTAAAGYMELIFKSEASGDFHFPSLERLDDHANNTTLSGAKLIGFFPPSGMSSIDLQSALEELKTLIGTPLVGSGTTNNIPLWQSSTTFTNSILSQVSSKILFNGDTVANLYRLSASHLSTDGFLNIFQGLTVGGNANIGGYAAVSGAFTASGLIDLAGVGALDNTSADQAALTLITGFLVKNNSATRQFYSLKIKPTINVGGSNANTTINILDIDTVNTVLTGVTVNLAKFAFGGATCFRIESTGDVTTSRNIIGLNDFTLSGEITAGISSILNTDTDGKVVHNFTSSVIKNNSNTRRFILNLFDVTLNAGVSNLNTTVDIVAIDTTNSSLTGLSVNLIKALFGGSERMALNSSGVLGLAGSGNGFNSFGLGKLSDVAAGDSEYLQMGHYGASHALIRPTRSGAGNFRDLIFATSDTERMRISAAGIITFGGEVKLDTANTLSNSTDNATVKKMKIVVGGITYYAFLSDNNT